MLQIAVSRKYIDYHTEKFGYKESNTDFVQGYIEKLREAGLKENYDDIIMKGFFLGKSFCNNFLITVFFRLK